MLFTYLKVQLQSAYSTIEFMDSLKLSAARSMAHAYADDNSRYGCLTFKGKEEDLDKFVASLRTVGEAFGTEEEHDSEDDKIY
jgi:hypothetical protein